MIAGVSDEVLALTDLTVEFLSMGMANSLNVAMSAGMLVFSAYQALRKLEP